MVINYSRLEYFKFKINVFLFYIFHTSNIRKYILISKCNISTLYL